MRDVMIDLETLGTGSNAPVLSIGAVGFDLETGQVGSEFYMCLRLQEQMDKGRLPDASTIYWWLNQSEDARKALTSGAPVNPAHALTRLSHWLCTEHNDAYVWGNGATFDISILESLFKTFEVPVPWAYNRAMDLRTFKRFVAEGASINKLGTAHNALDDAISQAAYVLEHYRK